jgi:hypothetical protein
MSLLHNGTKHNTESTILLSANNYSIGWTELSTTESIIIPSANNYAVSSTESIIMFPPVFTKELRINKAQHGTNNYAISQ